MPGVTSQVVCLFNEASRPVSWNEGCVRSISSHYRYGIWSPRVTREEVEFLVERECCCLAMSGVERNEMSWRGRVQRGVTTEAYQAVEDACRRLDDAIERDFILGEESN